MDGTFVRSYGAGSSSMQPLNDYYGIGAVNGSSISAQYCLVENLQNGIDVRHGSTVNFDVSYLNPTLRAINAENGSSVSLGNARVDKSLIVAPVEKTQNPPPIINISNNSSATVPALIIDGVGVVSCSIFVTDNSSVNMETYYQWNSSRAVSALSEQNSHSLKIDQNTGNKIYCDNGSSAIIYQLSGSNPGYQPYQLWQANLRAENGSMIRAIDHTSSSLSHSPDTGAGPYGVDLARIVFNG
jgi:hypothetical protein